MKIIIIILICLFFSLSIPNINEFLTDQTGAQSTDLTTSSQSTQPAQSTDSTMSSQSTQPAQAPSQSDSGGSLQSQINILSSTLATTTSTSLEAKKKVDYISSQIDQLKKDLQKPPN